LCYSLLNGRWKNKRPQVSLCIEFGRVEPVAIVSAETVFCAESPLWRLFGVN
jgi:hypothetical protein